MVKRYRESALVKKKKKKTSHRKKLKKAYKRTRKTMDSGVRIWKKLNSKQNRKAFGSAGKRANTVSKNIMDIL
ncbi:MAG TPA: hypothetical protein VMY59_08850 [Candidatus Thermoplasmatota archaeon]|nr:hypothetical protein [Candidatus Thermoplasmatota archaeon]